MRLSMIWMPLMFIVVILLAVMAVVLLIRARPRRTPASAEARREMASLPMPLLQKRALWSLLIGVATLGIIAAILSSTGTAAYWEDDDLRLLVVGIFLGGLAGHVVVLLLTVGVDRARRLDERDRLILSHAPATQSAAVLIALAAWVVSLGETYHDQGAVPMVYLYLIFGSVVLVNLIGQSLGILLGYWMQVGHGES